MAEPKITREDLEAGIRQLQGGAKQSVVDKKKAIVTTAGIGAVLLLLCVFLLGKRSGNKRTALVEIRRI
jgi:hypothetical protein